MAVFTFFDKHNQVNVSFASLSGIGSSNYLFQRTDRFDHEFSSEVYFKKTVITNEIPQFVYDRWYKATNFKIKGNRVEIIDWIESDPIDKIGENSIKNSIQIIGNNNNLSGNTFNLGDVNLDIFLHGLQDFVNNNENIPLDKKNNLISKLKDLINDPYLSGIAVNSLFQYIQPWLPR